MTNNVFHIDVGLNILQNQFLPFYLDIQATFSTFFFFFPSDLSGSSEFDLCAVMGEVCYGYESGNAVYSYQMFYDVILRKISLL